MSGPILISGIIINISWGALAVFIAVAAGFLLHWLATRNHKTFRFTWPDGKGPIIIKAKSEQAATKRARSLVQAMMFGPFALFYDPVARDRVMAQAKCEEIKGGK